MNSGSVLDLDYSDNNPVQNEFVNALGFRIRRNLDIDLFQAKVLKMSNDKLFLRFCCFIPHFHTSKHH